MKCPFRVCGLVFGTQALMRRHLEDDHALGERATVVAARLAHDLPVDELLAEPTPPRPRVAAPDPLVGLRRAAADSIAFEDKESLMTSQNGIEISTPITPPRPRAAKGPRAVPREVSVRAGKARAESLTPERRSAIASAGAQARNATVKASGGHAATAKGRLTTNGRMKAPAPIRELRDRIKATFESIRTGLDAQETVMLESIAASAKLVRRVLQ